MRYIRTHIYRCCVVQLSEAEMEAMDEFLWGSVPTRDQALECIRQQSKRQKRKVWRFSRYPKMKWGKLIFYVFDGSHSE